MATVPIPSSLPSPVVEEPRAPLYLCFLFIGQLHQVLHGLGTAIALARRPGYRIRILVASDAHLSFIEPLLPKSGKRPELALIGAGLLQRVASLRGMAVPPKTLTLLAATREVAHCDAIVVPERTSLRLRRFGVRRPRFIHVDHGAGDRAIGFDRRIAEFDFVLMAGEKHRARMLREGIVRPGAHAVAGYPKFDMADLARRPSERLFADDRPVVLYNPHFSPDLSSWPRCGPDIVGRILDDGRFNLIFAPHLRLADGRRSKARILKMFEACAGHPRLHVDLGSERLSDMTYTEQADIYLGDVSSQVYEFIRRPRPCVFVDPAARRWRSDENFSHWHFGDVVTAAGQVVEALALAATKHPWYRRTQETGFSKTISTAATPPSERAAAAIDHYCRSIYSTP